MVVNQCPNFSLSILAVAMSVALTNGAWANNFSGPSYNLNGSQTYDQFTIENADQTELAGVTLDRNADLTINQSLMMNVGRTSNSSSDLVGIFVSDDNSQLIAKGNTDILVINDS